MKNKWFIFLCLLVLLLVVGPVNSRPITTMINSFTGGVLTPRLDGRTDLDKYYSGCKTLENMLVLPYGGATKRPGTYYIADAKDAAVACRMIPFEFSVTQSYPMEFCNHAIRFYIDGGQIVDVNDDPYEIVSPYGTSDLFGLKFVQSADLMYFVHPDYQTQKLTRAGHTSWTIESVEFDYGPFLPENETAFTITPDSTVGDVNLITTGELFDANHVGSQWQLSYVVEANSTSGNLTVVDTNSATITVQLGRKFDFTTHGRAWSGTATLQRSYDLGSTWEDVRPAHYENDGDIQFTGQELVDDAIYRVYMTEFTSGNCRYSLIARGFLVNGVVKITAVTDANNAIGTVVHTLGDTSATTYWSEGAFSDYRGWPSAITFFQERLVLGSTLHQPQTMWFSNSFEWENFQTGTNDAQGFDYTLAADQANEIQWLLTRSDLLIGTGGGEWVMTGGVEIPLTPTNVRARRQSNIGSADIQATMANNVPLYVQRYARKVRQLSYDFASDNYVTPDLTLLAEHITESGIKEIDFQRSPSPILWCVLNNGDVAAMTFEPDQSVVSWHYHSFGGDVESVCVIPSTNEDEVWFAIERTVNGSTVRYIEQMQPQDWGTDQADAFFVDSGLSFDNGGTKTITGITKADPGVVTCAGHGFLDGEQVEIWDVVGMTEVNRKVFTVSNPATNTFELRNDGDTFDWNTTGYSTYLSGGSVYQVENTFTTLTHMESETVAIVGNGAYLGSDEVESGTITLSNFYNNVHIGLAYTAKLQTMRLNVPFAGGSMQGAYQRVVASTIRFYETLGCDAGVNFDEMESVIFRETDDPLYTVTPVFSGDRRLLIDGGYDTEAFICLRNNVPTPFTILAIIPEWEVNQR